MQYNISDVKITNNSKDAFYYDENNIPYIVHLTDENKTQCFPSGAFCVENLSDINEEYKEMVYCRTYGLPITIIETDRLVIREIKVEDVPRLYELYADESITRYMEGLYEDINQELEYTQKYIENIYGFYGFGMWVIVLKENDQVIGRAGLEYKEGYDGLELGFMLGVDYQKKGYAYEACNAILDYAVRELEQASFYAIVHEQNSSSLHLCEKLGFNKAEGYVNDEYVMMIKNDDKK